MLAVYWGQNGYGAVDPNRAHWEKSLADTCAAKPHYDVVILAFATQLAHGRNNETFIPEMNFGPHCHESAGESNPYLLRCPALAEGIRACQEMGKKVLLSIGGAKGSTGLESETEGTQAAEVAWNLFLGGSSPLRPFPGVTLDGLDLDLEAGNTAGSSNFVKAIRARMDGSGKKYWLTAAPQCPFPDAYLGPAPGRPLGDALHAFDYLFVQFYNNKGCGRGAVSAVTSSFAKWAELAKGGGPKILIGVPAAPHAASSGYLSREDLSQLVAEVHENEAFAGFMLWDASYDQNTFESSGTYGGFLKSLKL